MLLKGLYGFPLYLRNALEPAFFPVDPKRNCGAYLNSLKPCKGILRKNEFELHR